MKKSLKVAVLTAVFTAIAGFAPVAARTAAQQYRVDLTSSPEGAEVMIDGVTRGVTPLALYDLQSGEHRVRFSLKGYECADDFFRLAGEAQFVSRHVSLVAQKGLLLVTTEPEGCEIAINGFSAGTTPRLITTLDATTAHKLVISKTGYQSKTVEIRFAGRAPLVRHEKLVQDSGSLRIESEPAGAKVSVNGIERGTTPLELAEIPRGRVALALELDGYEPEKREVALTAGEEQKVTVTLKPRPSSLMLTSVPDGARFYLDGVACGRGPVIIDAVACGTHLVRAELEGYATVAREVKIGLAEKVSEEFRLENTRGRLEVRTSPAGAQVLVDGRQVGVTKSQTNSPRAMSEILTVENLDAGEHVLTVRRDGYAEVVKHPVVEVSRTTQATVKLQRMFTPNVEIATWSGSYKGVFVDRTDEAITLEVSMGILRTFQISEIREIKWLVE